jgi:HEAT repeat protein
VRKLSVVWLGIFAGLFTGLTTGMLLHPSWFKSWTPSLEDPSPAVRAAAVRRLGSKDRQALVGALEDKDADVRLLAAERLGGEGPDAEARARALVGALKDEHKGVRRAAAGSLSTLRKSAASVLEEALEDPDPRVREGAALAFQNPLHRKED